MMIGAWETYTAGGMDVISLSDGTGKEPEKVVIMLHGMSKSNEDWRNDNYQAGQFGDLTGIKWVFPSAPLTGDIWFYSERGNCALGDFCVTYDIPSI